MVLDLRREWRHVVEAKRRRGLWDRGSPSKLVVNQALRENDFSIMKDFTYGLRVQPTSVDSAFDLFHGSNKVFTSPFAACQNTPSKEESWDNSWREFRQVCGDGGGQKIHNNSEWEKFTRKLVAVA